MHIVILVDVQSIWDKIVLDSGSYLTKIPTFSAHVDVVYYVISWNRFRPRKELKDMGTILERPAKLRCVDGQLKWQLSIANLNCGVVGYR